jgi:phosphoribosylglycinamide formyltransferase-1
MSQGRGGVVVLVSGRGSNLQAIINAITHGELAAEIRAVISSEPGAPALARARTAGIPTHVVIHRDFPGRDQLDQALMQRIEAYQPQLVVLAGFMRIQGKDFIER